MTLRVDIHGLKEIEKRLTGVATDVATKAGQSANRAGATVLRKAVTETAPVSPRTTEGEQRTRRNKGGTTRQEIHGKIKNNVVIRKTKSTTSHEVQNTVGIRSNAYHASFVEWGSIHNTADPFMLRALKSTEGTVIDKIAATLNKRLIKAGA